MNKTGTKGTRNPILDLIYTLGKKRVHTFFYKDRCRKKKRQEAYRVPQNKRSVKRLF